MQMGNTPQQLTILTFTTDTTKHKKNVMDGYHSIPLNEESKPHTTFITEWDHFMYLRMSQGYPTEKSPVCCPDGWCTVFAGSRFCTNAKC